MDARVVVVAAEEDEQGKEGLAVGLCVVVEGVGDLGCEGEGFTISRAALVLRARRKDFLLLFFS